MIQVKVTTYQLRHEQITKTMACWRKEQLRPGLLHLAVDRSVDITQEVFERLEEILRSRVNENITQAMADDLATQAKNLLDLALAKGQAFLDSDGTETSGEVVYRLGGQPQYFK